MRVLFLTGVLACLAVPALLGAQEGAAVPAARVTITPVFGARLPFVAGRNTTVVVPGRVFPVVVSYANESDYGGTAGLDVEVRLAGRVGLAAGALYASADPVTAVTQAETGVVSEIQVAGPTVWIARAGLSYRLPEVDLGDGARPAGYLVLGPAWVRQDYRGTFLELGDERPIDSWALHAAYRARFPLARHLAIQAALEDVVPLWSRDRERERVERLLGLEPGTVLSGDFAARRTHVLMLNLGLALLL